MRDEERGDPVRGERPTLRGADGFRADEFGSEDEGDGAEADSEASNEKDRSDGGDDFDAKVDAEGKEEGVDAHSGDGEEEAGFPTELVGEGGEGDGGDEVDGGDDDDEERGRGREESGEEGDGVHDDAVDAAELLGEHDADDGDDGFVVVGVEDDFKDADAGFVGVGLFRGRLANAVWVV